ncbi:MAG: peptide ABC transporter substrate-binding protein [Vampirovibrionales bacterium]
MGFGFNLRFTSRVCLPLYVLLAGCLLLPMLTVTLTTGCIGQAHRQPTGMFRMNLGTEPPSLDPVEIIDLVSVTVVYQVMKGLTRYTDHQRIVGAYASSWDVSPDGKTYTFHLRRNGVWSDGKPVVAGDFLYGWQRVLDPKRGAPYAFLLFTIKNAEAYYKGELSTFSQVGVKALDDYTLRVELAKPYAYFLQIMAFPTTLPQRRDLIERWGERFTEADHFVGNGPYLLEEWTHDEQIVLKPNPTYFETPPQNNGVVMLMIPEPNTSLMMYESNELDFVETESSLPIKEVRRLKGRPDFHQNPLYAIAYTGFNTQKPPFDDARVRRAFTQSIDKSWFNRIFQGGQQAFGGFIAPGLFGYNPHAGLSFDVAAARRALAEAGYPNGKGFPTVEFLYANTTPENRQLSEILQYQWQKNLNVTVDLHSVEWKVYLRQLKEDPPHVYRLRWFVDYPDPDSFMGLFHSNNGNNFTRWHNPQYDTWVSQAATELDPARRQALYNQAQHKLLVDDTAIGPLFVMSKSYLIKPTVQGFSLDELNVVDLSNVRLNAQ